LFFQYSSLISVRGYLPSNPETRERLFDFSSEQESVRELTQRKQNLLLELRNYSENQKMSHDLSVAGIGISNLARDSNRTMGIIPAQTQLSTALAINLGLDGQLVSLSSVDLSVSLYSFCQSVYCL
jgi:Bardet-Biedl syndrome 2 protein